MVCNPVFCWQNVPTSAILLLYFLVLSAVGGHSAHVVLSAYRLGDFVRHVGCFDYWLVRQLHLPFHPTSLVAQYGAHRGPSDLAHLRSLTEMHPTLRVQCSVHVRTGEIFDNNLIPLDIFWYDTRTDSSLGGGGALNITTNPILPRGAILSKVYYESVAARLLAQEITTLHLCSGGVCTPGTSSDPSVEYLQRIRHVFHTAGIYVIDQSHLGADAAFIHMSNARVFVPSGGGYSTLIAALVTLRGGIVLS
jgi:hypothetical protein